MKKITAIRGIGSPLRRPGRMLSAAVALAIGVSGLAAIAAPAAPAEAASGSDFIPGYIISDELFYDGAALTASQIQYFLDSKIGTCTNGKCLNVATIAYPGRAREVSARTGNVICEAVPAGTVSVAELIYRAQVACGISAKVILVTLQKEQGLVTKKAPSDGALRAAMGMACPDTAPCDSAFAGLGTQIVTGTRQLKTYKAAAFARQPGVSYIGYNPNSECGGTSITIRNFATAALYNYTPYQPNSAALANMYTTGDTCSSYGNRNFWAYYNDWFGTSIGSSAADAIKSLYLVLGGTTGLLGAATEAPSCGSASSCAWVYERGVINWTRSGGPVAASGAIGTAWLANRAAFGLPTVPETEIADPRGNGFAQSFERGVVHSSAAGTFLVTSGTMGAYSAAGWLRGTVGWPTSSPVCGGVAGGCVQSFQGGVATVTAAGAGAFMRSDIANVYLADGAQAGSLGFPIATQSTVTDPNGNGVALSFENGIVHASARGTYAVPTAVMKAYSAAGWLRGPLGWPVGAFVCDTAGCAQAFAGGTIRTAVDGTGAFVATTVDPAVQAAYLAAGGETGPLGFAIAKATSITDKNGNGVVQSFSGGLIHAGPPGAFVVPTAVMPTYSASGWLRGSLGWPTAAAVCDSAGCSQSFTGGTILVPSGQTGFVVAPIATAAIRTLFDSSGGATGALGYPLVPQTLVTDKNGNGVAQTFQKGIVHSSAVGTFLVPTTVMSKYSAQGWLRGSLGWPVAAASCDSTGCVQQFQRGTIDTH